MLDGDPALVLALYARLPQDSMTRAQERDPENWFYYMGADPSYYLLAGIYDAVNLNTRATGQYKKGKAPVFEPYPLPEKRAALAAERAVRRTAAGLFRALGGQTAAVAGGDAGALFTPVPIKN